MKTKSKFLVLLGVIMLIITGFIIKPTQKEEKLIIGTWVCKGDNNLKMKFTKDNKCYSYYTDEPTEEFTYSIHREKTPSGIIVAYIKLVGITEPGFNPEYDIDGIDKDGFALRTKRMQVIFFIKQK